jgi:hypothetical protein
MTTILILNAISSLTAAAGLGGWSVWSRRRARQGIAVQPIYIDERR